MHPYATDSTERVRAIAILVILSLLLGRVVDSLVTFPGWAGLIVDVSAAGWFALLFWLTDQYLWRFAPLRWIHLFKVPDVQGDWVGELKSSWDGFATPRKCELRIQQSWTSICVHFLTEHGGKMSSRSYSRAASLLLDQDGCCVLRYEYHNEPDASRKEELDIHWGTTRVEIVEELGVRQLKGSYYTNRTPQTYGTFEVRRLT